MKAIKYASLFVALAALTACETPTNTNTNINRTNVNAANTVNANAAPTAQTLTEVPRPQSITAMMAQRGLCGPTMLPPLRTHAWKRS